jgi:hypothetical protein
MMRAFFDEASDNTDDFLMGGWLASFEEWEKFSEVWATELKFPPSISYFNHNEALGRKGEFKGWSESARDDKMLALAGVIARHNLIGLVGGIKIPQLASLFGSSVIPRRKLRSIIKFTEPYHHVCQCVVAVTLGYQVLEAKNLTDHVDFIFDEGVSYLADIIGNYPRLKAILPSEAKAIAGTIVSGNDKQIVALQAADFLVGQKLLQLRIEKKPKPLVVFDDGRIKEFPCYAKPLETIPQSISKLNVVWSTKQLEKVQERKRRKVEYESKKKQ